MLEERFELSGTKERNLAMELVRVTEAAALRAGRWMGKGEKEMADQAAVDAVEGTRLLSLGLPGALAVVATAERGSMYGAPPGVFYMEKIAVGPAARNVVDINSPI